MKITNDLLEQYVANEEKLKALLEENNTIRIMLKEAGSTSTRDYVVLVNEISGALRLPGKDILIKRFGAEKIEPLLVQGEPYKTVTVRAKAKEAV